jgi:hypothetical protein
MFESGIKTTAEIYASASNGTEILCSEMKELHTVKIRDIHSWFS